MDWLWLIGIVSSVSILSKGGGIFGYIFVIFRLFHHSRDDFILLLVLFLEVDR